VSQPVRGERDEGSSGLSFDGPETLRSLSRRLVDLTLPVVDSQGRFGLETEFDIAISFEDQNWQGSTFRMFAHTGTHVDAPIHFIRGSVGIDQVPLDQLIGRGWIFDLSDKGASEAITQRDLEARDPGFLPGDIAVLRTDWTDKHWGTETFFAESPYLTTKAAAWLVENKAKAIVYDFSEEYVVRKPGFRGEECEVHHIILGNGLWNIEYVTGLGRLKSPSTTIVALPLKLVGLDASPARVIAFEEED
jgi:arylformamidase